MKNIYANCYPFGSSTDPCLKRLEALNLCVFSKTVKKDLRGLIVSGMQFCFILVSFGGAFLLHYAITSLRHYAFTTAYTILG